MKQIKAEVTAKGKHITGLPRPHGRNIDFSQTITLKCPEIAREAEPGQFIMVRCGNECTLPRPFSIHHINNDELKLYFAVLDGGKGTHWLSQRQIGDNVEMFGPLGNSFTVNPKANNFLLVAGGMGVAPLYFLEQKILKNKLSVTRLYGTAIKNCYPPASPGVKLIIATEDGSAGHKGLITDLLPNYIKSADQIFACGPLGMYRAMVEIPELKGKDVQVSLEVVMGCGAGVCYGCTIKTKSGLKQACKDGPVFQLDEIMWGEWSGSAV